MEQVINNIVPNTIYCIEKNNKSFRKKSIDTNKIYDTCKKMCNRKKNAFANIRKEHSTFIDKVNIYEIINEEIHELDVLAKMLLIPEIVEDEVANNEYNITDQELNNSIVKKSENILLDEAIKDNDEFFLKDE